MIDEVGNGGIYGGIEILRRRRVELERGREQKVRERFGGVRQGDARSVAEGGGDDTGEDDRRCDEAV